jgi:hypothetical protein
MGTVTVQPGQTYRDRRRARLMAVVRVCDCGRAGQGPHVVLREVRGAAAAVWLWRQVTRVVHLSWDGQRWSMPAGYRAEASC